MTSITSPALRRLALAASVAACLGVGACSSMSSIQRDTAVGAAVGGAAGAVLTNGSPVGAIGGAVIGGVIANENHKK